MIQLRYNAPEPPADVRGAIREILARGGPPETDPATTELERETEGMSVKKRYAFMTDRQQDRILQVMEKDVGTTASAVADLLGIDVFQASSNMIQLAKEGRLTKRRAGGRNLYTRIW